MSDILAALRSNPDARDTFPLGNEIWFDNHSNTFDEGLGASRSADMPKRRRSGADQFCVHRVDADRDENTLLFTIEYKPAHKLPTEYLRAGLRPINLWNEVVQRPTIPVDRDEKLQYNADLLTGSVLTQAYSYMIHEGLSYSCLTTGSCQVFLHVAQGEPETLQYFLAEPNLDVRAMSDDLSDDEWVRTPITAVGRMLSLCSMSLHTPIRSHHWRNETISRLHVWEVDFEHILQQIPEDEVHSTPPGSEYMPSSSPISSPSGAPRHYTLRPRAGCRPDEVQGSSPTNDSDSDDASVHNASGARKRALSDFSSSPPQERPSGSGRQYKRTGRAAPAESLDYCTQRCLLGLQTQGQLDEDCPNVVRHRTSPKGDRHQIDTIDLTRLLKQQLDADLDHYCTPCGPSGIRGAPFKLSPMPYGYTFIGKGTTDRGWEEVRREAEVYRVLQPVQGSAVPVFLGTVDLNKIYFLHGGARIKHFLLLSWGGKQANLVKDERVLWVEIQRTTRELHRLGVHHGDLHRSNVLWNSQLGRVQLIDFHKSKLLRSKPRAKRKRTVIDDISPRKRVHVT